MVCHPALSSEFCLCFSLRFFFLSGSQGQKKGPKVFVTFLDIGLKTTLKLSGRYILKNPLYSLPN